MAKNEGWPRTRANGTQRNDPDPYFASPDGYHRLSRDLAGPLRMGTTPEAGPKGPAVRADRDFTSDSGMDRIDPTAGHDINAGKYKSVLIAQAERGEGRQYRKVSEKKGP